jgi:hypothetical protein
MRHALFLLALFAASPLWADDKPKLPANLQTVPEPPPPPPGYEPNPALEPQITITTRGEDKAEEYRIGGKLYMVKVTPKHGAPYYLVDDKGDGNFVRQSLDSGIRVPQWVLFKF